jgi:hypothetical protein
MSAANVTFKNAAITWTQADDLWDYDLDFDYTDPIDSDVHHIRVVLSHQNGSTVGAYSGRFTYLVNDSFGGGNCPAPEVTVNGSLVYERTADTEMTLESRNGTFCGVDAVGVDSNGLVDPSYTFPTSADGWGNNFNIFTSSFDPTTLAGQYAYRWQAGSGDGNTRTLLAGVNAHSPLDGETYFGFGDPVSSSDACIQGFICNWAGPGNNSTLLDYSQRQHITLDTLSGLFEPTNAAASNITYAPTNDCTYDGSGIFQYDRNGDQDLADEDDSTTVVDDSGSGLAFDLFPAAAGQNMCQTIQGRGYSLPATPSYANAYTGPVHP